jgi:hypothetical protein
MEYSVVRLDLFQSISKSMVYNPNKIQSEWIYNDLDHFGSMKYIEIFPS